MSTIKIFTFRALLVVLIVQTFKVNSLHLQARAHGLCTATRFCPYPAAETPSVTLFQIQALLSEIRWNWRVQRFSRVFGPSSSFFSVLILWSHLEHLLVGTPEVLVGEQYLCQDSFFFHFVFREGRLILCILLWQELITDRNNWSSWVAMYSAAKRLDKYFCYLLVIFRQGIRNVGTSWGPANLCHRLGIVFLSYWWGDDFILCLL